MKKNTIQDFQIGDKVYHLSNPKLPMVVIAKKDELNEVSCRWVDNDGQVQCVEFMAEEIGKSSDLGSKTSYETRLP